MNEARVAFLYKAASILPAAQENLKSYYRMRCKDVSKGYGLPQKHFSAQVMCRHCCLDWKKGTEVKVRSIKLSKRQKKRIKSEKKLKKRAYKVQLLCSNEIEQTCSFCKHSVKKVALKPSKTKITPIKKDNLQQPKKETKGAPHKLKETVNMKNIVETDVYSNTKQVFSLNNTKNNLKSKIKEQKIIKNNKKKKDKFAGLCKKAVLITAQLKKDKEKQNKLSLFLKPSS